MWQGNGVLDSATRTRDLLCSKRTRNKQKRRPPKVAIETLADLLFCSHSTNVMVASRNYNAVARFVHPPERNVRSPLHGPPVTYCISCAIGYKRNACTC